MTDFERALAEIGWDPQPTDDEQVFSIIVFDHQGRVPGDFLGLAMYTDGEASLRIAVPLIDADLDRLDEVELPDSIDGYELEFDDDDADKLDGESDDDGARFLVHVSASWSGVAWTLLDPLDVALSFVAGLMSDGIVRLRDASDDDQVAVTIQGLAALKATDPRAAVRQALEAADAALRLGDPRVASILQLAAAEVMLQLGEVAGAHVLAESAWRRLGEPSDEGEWLTVVARARASRRFLDEAIQLMREGIAAAGTPSDRARLRGNLGVILAQEYRRQEAIVELVAALESRDLNHADRLVFEEQLRHVRDATGAPDAGRRMRTGDSLDDVEAILNTIAGLVVVTDRDEFERRRPQIERLVNDVETQRDLLGSRQLARVSHTKAVLAYMAGDHALSARRLAEAAELADVAGDLSYVSWLRTQAASFGFVDDIEPQPHSSPYERVAFYANRALVEFAKLDADSSVQNVRGALDLALAALAVTDAERHRYVEVADRLMWTDFTLRIYEMTLIGALAVADHELAFEILERARAQGTPLERSSVTSAVDTSEPVEPITDLELSVGGAREALGELAVAPPTIASPRAGRTSELGEDGVRRVAITGVMAALVGHAEAWWWGCHVFSDRLHWTLRSPSGVCSSGFVTLDGGVAALRELTDAFASIELVEDLAIHPMCGDRDRRLDSLLARLAAVLLPAQLTEAIVAAADRGDVIDVVWAPSHELARLPVVMLPIDGSRSLIDGARLVMAPPTSLLVAATPVSRLVRRRPVVAVLGSDPDLKDPTPLLDAFGVRADVRLVDGMPLRTTIAEFLSIDPAAIAVFLGHIHHGASNPLGAAMVLADDHGLALLSAGSLLNAAPRGSPHVMVLAGCSSLSASTAGTGEWWGLATALLWQGSRHVFGSTWDLLNGLATMQFAVDLVEGVRAGKPPLQVLHEAQRARFRSWQQRGRPALADADRDQPYSWAGWSLVSLAPPR